MADAQDLPVIDDAGDEYINRPLASIMVRWIAGTFITPNQVTLASFLLGLISIWLMAHKSYFPVLSGAVLLQFSIIVDCVDGQLARAKQMTSEWGDIFDHTTDDAKIVLITLAVAYHLYEVSGPAFTVAIVAPALVIVLFATSCQYFYCMEYASVRKGRNARELLGCIYRSREMFTARKVNIKDMFPKLVLGYYLFRLGVVWFIIRITNPRRLSDSGALWSFQPDAQVYYSAQLKALKMWRFMGMGVFALILLGFALMGRVLYSPVAYIGLLPFFLIAWRRQVQCDSDFLRHAQPAYMPQGIRTETAL